MTDRKILHQMTRIKNVYDEAKCKIYIVESLPHFLSKDGLVLIKELFEAVEYDILCNLINQTKIKQDENATKELLYLLNKNNNVHNYIKTKKIKNKDPSIKLVIDSFLDDEILNKYIFKSGEETAIENAQFRKMIKENEVHLKFIKEYSFKMENTVTECEKILDQQLIKKKENELKLESSKQHSEEQLKSFRNICMKKISADEIQYKEILEILNEEVKTSVLRYKKILDEHILKEKELRVQRRKAEDQLRSMLRKFDIDMGNKDKEYQDLLNEYNEQCEVYNKIQQDVRNQEGEYEKIINEKEIERERMHNELVYQFLINKAARKIQIYWREFVRSKNVKKRKKGKAKTHSGDKKTA